MPIPQHGDVTVFTPAGLEKVLMLIHNLKV